MPTLEQAIEAFGKRYGYPPAKARVETERLIRIAVDERLSGRDPTAIDRVPDELRQHAHDQLADRLAAGEGNPDVLRISGLTGGRA
jgi:hypothetical protein